jgi:hypothetical protein
VVFIKSRPYLMICFTYLTESWNYRNVCQQIATFRTFLSVLG